MTATQAISGFSSHVLFVSCKYSNNGMELIVAYTFLQMGFLIPDLADRF